MNATAKAGRQYQITNKIDEKSSGADDSRSVPFSMCTTPFNQAGMGIHSPQLPRACSSSHVVVEICLGRLSLAQEHLYDPGPFEEQSDDFILRRLSFSMTTFLGINCCPRWKPPAKSPWLMLICTIAIFVRVVVL